MYDSLGISLEVLSFCEAIEKKLHARFEKVDQIAEYNQLKVIRAMQEHRVSDMHFAATTGYGYNDLGRDALEAVFASVFNAQAGLVRPQLISGTHALTVALAGNLRPGDTILSPIGKPYDTLEEVIGIRETKGSLKEYGISYKQVEFNKGNIDFEAIKIALTPDVKLVLIQRSKGYDMRPTLSVEQIGELIVFIKEIKPNTICMVDNCYGEFVQTIEPSDLGADLVVGSLIKNPGGGLAPIGGYIVGKEEYVDQAAYRLTAPGLGKEVGATLGINGLLYQGLFLAPTVVAAAHKGAILAGKIFETLGYNALPNGEEERYDIIQAIEIGTEEGIIAFCQGIQAAAPVDSYVKPEPWDMPGYDSKVIMAAGSFVQGSSIELSADAPIKPPYTVYFQGGLTYPHAKFGVMKALQAMIDVGIVKLPSKNQGNI
ncbi:MAG: methionine gamma-lyase family protein [Vallitaleaceae bacterium]|nr:methionine gamma-lyase family protein [Vallitaleaceae bacterium]